MAETFKLRGHHLLCLLTYRGEGYTPEFVKNFDEVVESLNENAEIEIVGGTNAICAALHGDHGALCESGDHCLTERTRKRDQVAIADVNKALGLSLTIVSSLAFGAKNLVNLRPGFADGSLRSACKDCEWNELCSQIAEDDFIGVRFA